MTINAYPTDETGGDKPLALRILILLALLGFPFRLPATPNDPFARALEERTPGLLVKYGVPGAVVSRISNGGVAWTKAFGRANLRTGTLMQTNMVFNHGSNGKLLTMW